MINPNVNQKLVIKYLTNFGLMLKAIAVALYYALEIQNNVVVS